ncbi:MAG: hypothetical protein JNL72_04860 [Flavipsychrobacter sp.]|nr:hypothetical protein [Flavipsychrobacter sp.]
MFDIENRGQYPLKNVKAIVTDISIAFSSKYIKYERKGLSHEVNTKPTQNFDVSFTKDFGAIPANTGEIPLHTSIVSPQLNGETDFGYTVQFFWGSGTLTYFIRCCFKESGPTLKGVECLLNGKKVAYSNYMTTDLPKQ